MSYPIQLVLDGRRCVVIGGGRVATRKVEALRLAGADVHVVSPKFEPELLSRNDITRHEQPYEPSVLTGAFLVMVCTDDRTVNAAVFADARAAGAIVNVADDPEHCDFYVPAVVRRGPIQIAIGTGGSSPELAATLRKRIEGAIPESYAVLAEELHRIRPIVKQSIPRQADRSRLFETLCGEDSIRRFLSEGPDAWRQWFDGLLKQATA